jgi:hypothetical protein
MSATTIDTKAVQRRALRFTTMADLTRELDALEAAERSGRLKIRGNWQPGQVIGHLATWAEFTYNGNPLKPPWIVRFIVKRRKNRYLNQGLPAGVRIPRIKDGTLGTEHQPFEQALARYRRVLDRLDREVPTLPNVIFGPLTHEEWKALQFRHAELHLGFLDPGA